MNLATYQRNDLETAAHADGAGWHTVGARIEKGASAHETLKAAGLDWTVVKRPLRAVIAGGDVDGNGLMPTLSADIPNKFGLVRERDNKVFDIVGKDWKFPQNSDVADFFDGFVKAGDLTPHAAGATDGGRNVFFVAKLNKSFTFLGKDMSSGYLCFVNPFKHGAAVRITPFASRLWCANQLPLVFNSGAGFRFTHVARNGFKVDLAQKLIQESVESFERYQHQAHVLAGGRATGAQLEAFFRKVYQIEHAPKGTDPELAAEINERHDAALEKIMMAHNDQPGIEYGQGTWWHATNTVTYIADHLGRGKNEAKRFHVANFGAGAVRKQQAVALAYKYATE